MTEKVLADASALQAMLQIAMPATSVVMLEEMTALVETEVLCFPRAVARDLGTTARDEPVAVWVAGLGTKLNPFRADIKYMRPLMGYVKACGFEEGFTLLSGAEPSVADVARLACQYSDEGREFTIASEDVGDAPLSPTMGQLCAAASWPRISAREAAINLGLGRFLV